MEDIIRASFTEFYKALAQTNQTLIKATTAVEDRRQSILGLLENSFQMPEPPAGEGLYQQICRESIATLGIQINQWAGGVRETIRRSEFVNRHEKSIMVIAFADVKAGKSTLGNFVSGFYLKDTPYADLYQPINYQIEDFSAASQENKMMRCLPLPFPENEVEATSAIQYYTLNQGLTWVDTPGLHSLTREHGDLTKEYIQFADLVLFLTSSSAPLKQDEGDGLKQLFERDKPVMAVITKSDDSKTTIQHTAQGRKRVTLTIPKSPENRAAQERYVMETIHPFSKNLLENPSIVSISVKLARDAVRTGDQALYSGSNLHVFFSQMCSILSERAVELKMRRPHTEVNNCISDLIGSEQDSNSIEGQKKALSDNLRALDALAQNQETSIGNITSKLEGILPTALSSALRLLRTQGKLNDASLVRAEMTRIISQECIAQCLATYQEKFQSAHITIRLPEISIGSEIGGGFRTTTQQIHTTVLIERDPKGILERVERLLDKDKKFYRSSLQTETIPTGDNYREFLNNNWEKLRPLVEEYVKSLVCDLYQSCIQPLQTCYAAMISQMEILEQELVKLKFQGGKDETEIAK